MFMMRAAGLLFQVNNQYDYIREKCSDYIVQESTAPDIIMEATNSRIHFSQDFKLRYDNEVISAAEAEYDAAPYMIYHLLPDFDAVWLHAAVIELDGQAYAFTAPSGYGKSTHIHLWQQAFGDQIRVINGDNPILRVHDGVFYAYGTPFCGKEGYQINTGVPLRGICCLQHDDNNYIERREPASAFARLLADNYNITPETLESHMQIYERLVESVPVYILHCNESPEAALVAWEGMRQVE